MLYWGDIHGLGSINIHTSSELIFLYFAFVLKILTMIFFFQKFILTLLICISINNNIDISNSFILHSQDKMNDNEYLIRKDTIPKACIKKINADSLNNKPDSVRNMLQKIINSKLGNSRAFRPQIF